MGKDKATLLVEHALEFIVSIHTGGHFFTEFQCLVVDPVLNIDQ